MNPIFTLTKKFLQSDREGLLQNFSFYPIDSKEHKYMLNVVEVIGDILQAKFMKNKVVEKKLTLIYTSLRAKIITINNILDFRHIYSKDAENLHYSAQRRDDAQKIVLQGDALLEIKTKCMYHLEWDARILFCNAIRRYKKNY